MMIVKMPALPAMTNVTAAGGGDSNYGVHNTDSTAATIRNSPSTGTGATGANLQH